MNQSKWRKQAAPIIQAVLLGNKERSEDEVRKLLRDAYPFGERKYHPYKIWLDEIKRQMGKLWPVGHKVAWENNNKRVSAAQSKLQEWESLYGRREA